MPRFALEIEGTLTTFLVVEASSPAEAMASVRRAIDKGEVFAHAFRDCNWSDAIVTLTGPSAEAPNDLGAYDVDWTADPPSPVVK